jgi:hypothetical protein
MFAGHLADGPYTRAILTRVGLFVGATIALPFVLYGIAEISDCASIAGACGAVGLGVSMFGKPPIYLLFIASFIGITVRRLRDLGLPVSLAAIVPVMMLADFSFAVSFGAPWSMAFTIGAIGGWPRHLFMALVCVAFLCLVPAGPNGSRKGRDWGYAGVIAFCIVLLGAADAAFSIFRAISLFVYGVKAIIIVPAAMRYFSLYGLPAMLVASLTLVAWQHRWRL